MLLLRLFQEHLPLGSHPLGHGGQQPQGCDGPGYFVGWEQELKAAWRLQEGSAAEEKEFTKDIFEPKDPTDEAPVLARWSDGFEGEIAAVSVVKWRSMKAAETSVASYKKAFWENPGPNGVRLEVRVKSDRRRLVWLGEKPSGSGAKFSQICQAPVDSFGSQEQAIEMMIKIGKEYASSTVAKGDLYKRRGELMLSSQAQRKRPASRSEQKTEVEVQAHDQVKVQAHDEAPVTPPTKKTRGRRWSWGVLDMAFSEEDIMGMEEYASSTVLRD